MARVTPSYTQDFYLVVKLNLSSGSTYTLKINGAKTPDQGLTKAKVNTVFANVFKDTNVAGYDLLCVSDGVHQAVSINDMYFEAVARTIEELS